VDTGPILGDSERDICFVALACVGWSDHNISRRRCRGAQGGSDGDHAGSQNARPPSHPAQTLATSCLPLSGQMQRLSAAPNSSRQACRSYAQPQHPAFPCARVCRVLDDRPPGRFLHRCAAISLLSSRLGDAGNTREAPADEGGGPRRGPDVRSSDRSAIGPRDDEAALDQREHADQEPLHHVGTAGFEPTTP
jgi:hypothetical protein